ncbi:MAG: ABC transporter ATP-binding protein [Candidatus Eremiobacteraeota bacterium]|nr:ABC transporter ATP-binding protein [Candidatus Eremiobacteraeota bacterium]
MSVTVSFNRVGVRYPGADRDALRDISLSIGAGEFAVVVGPSGCGKSTLLRTVNCLIEPTSGTVCVDERDTARFAPHELRRRIGYVIQAVGLFPHMTVQRNVALVPSLLGWDSPRIAQRTEELLELVRLQPERYAQRYPRQLSGGEQQRVGVARALAGDPDILLMDEPFGALDAIVRRSLQDELLEIVRRAGPTVIFVTHDVDEALRLADRIVVMRDGGIEQAGTPLEVLSKPQTPYVADLLQASDTVRRLSLMHVRDAMQAVTPNGDTEIRADATLRDALNNFLLGAVTLRVVEDGRVVGALNFDALRKAMSRT